MIDGLVAVEATIAPSTYGLGVYRWWEPHMQLPAVWNELTGGTRTERADACRVEDYLRIDVVMVPPASPDHGQDMLAVEDYADLAAVAFDTALAQSNPLSGAVQTGRRLGMQTSNERLGDEGTLTGFRIPLELKLIRNYP